MEKSVPYSEPYKKKMRRYTNINHIQEEPLKDGSSYIYVIENYPQNNIKVGITTNPKQRFQSLSGSNGGGNKIIKIAISEPTFYYPMEHLIHDTFSRYRIPNTEWFSKAFYNYTDKNFYEEIVGYVEKLFNDISYHRINERYKEKVNEGRKTHNHNTRR